MFVLRLWDIGNREEGVVSTCATFISKLQMTSQPDRSALASQASHANFLLCTSSPASTKEVIMLQSPSTVNSTACAVTPSFTASETQGRSNADRLLCAKHATLRRLHHALRLMQLPTTLPSRKIRLNSPSRLHPPAAAGYVSPARPSSPNRSSSPGIHPHLCIPPVSQC